MCSEQLSHDTFDGWSCPSELEEWTRDGPQIQFSSLCPHNTLNRNSSVYTDLTSTEYCMLSEYRMFCSIYPTSTRNPTVEDLQTKDRLEITILCIFLLCCALLSTTEHWRYRLEIDARIEVDAVLEAEVKKRQSRIMSTSDVERDTFGDRMDSSRLFGSTITAFNDHKKRHAPKLQLFRMNSRMNSMDESEEKKEDVDVKGVDRPSRAFPQRPFLDKTKSSDHKPSTKKSSSSPSVPRRVTYKRSRLANMVAQLQAFLPTLVISLLVIGAWLHCNFVGTQCQTRSRLTLQQQQQQQQQQVWHFFLLRCCCAVFEDHHSRYDSYSCFNSVFYLLSSYSTSVHSLGYILRVQTRSCARTCGICTVQTWRTLITVFWHSMSRSFLLWLCGTWCLSAHICLKSYENCIITNVVWM